MTDLSMVRDLLTELTLQSLQTEFERIKRSLQQHGHDALYSVYARMFVCHLIQGQFDQAAQARTLLCDCLSHEEELYGVVDQMESAALLSRAMWHQDFFNAFEAGVTLAEQGAGNIARTLHEKLDPKNLTLIVTWLRTPSAARATA